LLDPQAIRNAPEAIRDAIHKKRLGQPHVVDEWLSRDRTRRETGARLDQLRHRQKKGGEEISQLKRHRSGAQADVDGLLSEANALKAEQEAIATTHAEAEAEADRLMLLMPAVPDPDWPVGADATANVVVRTWAEPAHPPVTIAGGRRDHIALGRDLDIVDIERGVKLAGSRSYVLRGEGARLHAAVLEFARDLLVRRGYEPLVVPVLVNEACMTGTGYFPAGRDQAYVTQDGGVLVGTSEVSLASFYSGEILDLEAPMKLCALSTCFRREAGAAGRDTAGLYRVHQFDKVEQVIIHRADEGEHAALLEEIIGNAEAVLQALRLPYRVVKNCTGDMGQAKWRMYDIETWMPSRGGYGETHSGSALRDFQSRRLNMRYRDASTASKSARYCYTLNNTAIASPRVLISILEQYQNADGSVTVPAALREYMDGQERISRA
jgi:seryl-tRNA synthetase